MLNGINVLQEVADTEDCSKDQTSTSELRGGFAFEGQCIGTSPHIPSLLLLEFNTVRQCVRIQTVDMETSQTTAHIMNTCRVRRISLLKRSAKSWKNPFYDMLLTILEYFKKDLVLDQL